MPTPATLNTDFQRAIQYALENKRQQCWQSGSVHHPAVEFKEQTLKCMYAPKQVQPVCSEECYKKRFKVKMAARSKLDHFFNCLCENKVIVHLGKVSSV